MMNRIQAYKLTLGGVAFALFAAIFAVVAVADTPDWQGDLSRQLLAEKDCELNYLTDIKNFELLGKPTIEARAHCKDKRAFDATRSGNVKQFELRSCQVVTC